MLIYLDTNIVIYAVEQSAGYGPRALARLNTARTNGDQLAFSDLTRLECRVKPMKMGDAALLADFDTFFAASLGVKVPILSSAFDRATTIRATFNFKTVDSLHLAAAVEGGCDVFLTHDTRLSRFTDIQVEVLP